MSHSFSQNHTSIITFRCPKDIKMQIKSFTDTHNLSISDMARQALVLFMQQANSCERSDNVVGGSNEATLAVIYRSKPPIKRDAVIHHHIAFLNRDEHDYKGFRFRISRQKNILQRYFSANNYGSESAALTAALTVRDYVEEQLMLRPDEYVNIYEESWKVAPRIQQSRRR